MIAAACRSFRKNGFSGIGGDGLAKEAGVTSGAFYGHFASKEAAFKQVVATVLDEMRARLLDVREACGSKWVEVFVDYYLQHMIVCDMGESCPLFSLSLEVARSNEEIRSAYEAGMQKAAAAVADGLEGGSLEERKKRAWALLSVLSGGVTLARAAASHELSQEIADALRAAALQAAGPAAGGPK
jgi:TetR/AcrR family transcriptional regulator, transcriptional repressor for nem operon